MSWQRLEHFSKVTATVGLFIILCGFVTSDTFHITQLHDLLFIQKYLLVQLKKRRKKKSYMVRDVADDFNIAGVFILSRKLPLQRPVVAVIHLEKREDNLILGVIVWVCMLVSTCVCVCMCVCVCVCVCTSTLASPNVRLAFSSDRPQAAYSSGVSTIVGTLE